MVPGGIDVAYYGWSLTWNESRMSQELYLTKPVILETSEWLQKLNNETNKEHAFGDALNRVIKQSCRLPMSQ